jgi:hypothetical protein
MMTEEVPKLKMLIADEPVGVAPENPIRFYHWSIEEKDIEATARKVFEKDQIRKTNILWKPCIRSACLLRTGRFHPNVRGVPVVDSLLLPLRQ